MNWNSIVVVISLLLAVFAVYREYKRPNKAYLLWRIVAVLIAIVALACIYLPVSYNINANTQTGTGNILLTKGFDKDSIKAEKNIFTLDKTIHQQYPRAQLVYNLQDIPDNGPLNVYGYGLDEDNLKELHGQPVIFHPSAAPDGFLAANWTNNVKTGQQLQVQGTYKNTSAKSYQLVLKGLNTTVDSVNIPAGGNTAFTLSTTPKQRGRAVYSLITLNGKDTLQQEQLPVIITPVQPLKILILSASPDFETKFLKEWLGGNGYSVASRSNITKGKFGQDYINIDQPDLTHITTALLSKFDMVIGDLSVLKSFNPPENSVLQQEVNQKGLGIIIRADSSDKKSSWLQSNFPLSYQSGKLPAPATLLFQNKQQTTKLTIGPERIIPQNNTQQLIADDQGQVLAGAAISGAGKLLFTTINNTYSWMLAGNQKDYNAYWSLLINKAAKKLPATVQWLVATDFPTVNKPVKFVAESGMPLTGVQVNGESVYPAQNPAAPFQQVYTFYPDKYGWQQLKQPDSAPFWWYVWTNDAWLSLNAAKKIALTNNYISHNMVTRKKSENTSQKISKNVPKVYFYILFLMAVTFLWAGQKFLGTS